MTTQQLESLYAILKTSKNADDLLSIDGSNPAWTLVKEHVESAMYAHVDQLESNTLNVTLYDDEYDDIGGFEITKSNESGEYKLFWDDDDDDGGDSE